MSTHFCDLTCRYASWPEDLALDGAGSCRTFQAIYCEKKETLRLQQCPLHGERETNPDAFPEKSNSQQTTMKMFGQKHESRKHERPETQK